ncbi:MAG: hypothetical protein AAB456_00185 [Patescibacteria group bacterium]
MTEAETQAALEAEAQAKAEAEAAKAAEDAEFEASIADLSDEEKEAKRAERQAQMHPDNQDYEAELAREREARKKAEDALADRRFKESERKRKEEDEGTGDNPDDKPLTASQLEQILSRDREANRKEVRNVQATEIAGKLATSEVEKNLIVEVWKNRTFPEHLTLDEQIEEAYAIANRKKLIGERNEALRALRGKDNINTNPAATHHDAPKAGAPKLSPADQTATTAAGFIWNGVTRRYEKKLARGLLIIDPQTKKTRLIKA